MAISSEHIMQHLHMYNYANVANSSDIVTFRTDIATYSTASLRKALPSLLKALHRRKKDGLVVSVALV